MNKKIAVLLVLSFIISSGIHAQYKTQAEKEFLIKLELYKNTEASRSAVYNRATLDKFLLLHFSFDTLAFEGFDYIFSFLKIASEKNKFQVNARDSVPMLSFLCNEYVIAINKIDGSIYKLKGFAVNDFNELMNFMKSQRYSNLQTRRKFVAHYKIEGVDLNCLYKAYEKMDKENCSGCPPVITLH